MYSRGYPESWLVAFVAALLFPAFSAGCKSGAHAGRQIDVGKLVAGPDAPLIESTLRTNALPWLDKAHSTEYRRITKSVNRVDALFAEKGKALPPVTNSTFRIRMETEISNLEDPGVKARVNVHADLHLPNIEERLHLFAESFDPDKLPGVKSTDEKQAVFVGLRRIGDIFSTPALDLRAGARWHGRPVAFGRAEIGHCFTSGPWSIYPEQTGFWFTDDGTGERTSLAVERLLGESMMAQSYSGCLYSETSRGFEWQESLGFEFIAHGTRENPRKTLSTQVSGFGHVDDRNLVDSYRWDVLTLRLPLYSNWLYVEITPRLEWANDDNWHPKWSLLFTIDDFYR